MDALAMVEDEVRELVRRRGIDPVHDVPGMRRLIEDAVADYDERSSGGGLPRLLDSPGAVKVVLDAVAGFGPLQPYLDDPEVEELWINEPGKVFVARRGVAELTTTILTDDQVRDLVERMLKASGRRVDLSSPFVDATLADGSRLHVAIPDVTRRHRAIKTPQSAVAALRRAVPYFCSRPVGSEAAGSNARGSPRRTATSARRSPPTASARSRTTLPGS